MNVEEFVRNTIRRSLAKYLEEHPGGSGGGIGNLFKVDGYSYGQVLGIEENLSASPDGNPYNYYSYIYPHFIVDRLCDHDTAVSLIRAAILKKLNLGTFNLDVGIQGLVTKTPTLHIELGEFTDLPDNFADEVLNYETLMFNPEAQPTSYPEADVTKFNNTYYQKASCVVRIQFPDGSSLRMPQFAVFMFRGHGRIAVNGLKSKDNAYVDTGYTMDGKYQFFVKGYGVGYNTPSTGNDGGLIIPCGAYKSDLESTTIRFNAVKRTTTHMWGAEGEMFRNYVNNSGQNLDVSFNVSVRPFEVTTNARTSRIRWDNLSGTKDFTNYDLNLVDESVPLLLYSDNPNTDRLPFVLQKFTLSKLNEYDIYQDVAEFYPALVPDRNGNLVGALIKDVIRESQTSITGWERLTTDELNEILMNGFNSTNAHLILLPETGTFVEMNEQGAEVQ